MNDGISRREALGLGVATMAAAHLPLSGARENATRFRERLPMLLEASGTPGMSLVYVKNGAVKELYGAGMANKATGQPVTEETIFEAASLSKPAFALAVFRTIEAGKLSLDEPLQKHLDKPFAEDARIEKVTARHVLSHRTGLPNWRPNGGKLEFQAEPGEKFGYSGEGFMFLSHVLAAIHKQPTDSYMESLVWEKLGVTQSSFKWQERFEQTHALGYQTNGTSLPKFKPDAENVGGGLHTSAKEFANVLLAYLDPKFMPAERLREVGRTHSDVTANLGWGLGWGVSDEGGRKTLWHWGSNRGFKSFAVLEPERKAGLAVFTNSDHGQRICAAAVRDYLDLDHSAFYWRNISM